MIGSPRPFRATGGPTFDGWAGIDRTALPWSPGMTMALAAADQAGIGP
jgi:hypothetical protein